jgi:Xaa-Pro aminopeptidase
MSRGHLIIRKQSACLFVDGRYLTVADSQSAIQVEELNGENEIGFLKGCKVLGFDGSVLTYDEHLLLWKKARKAKIKLLSRPNLLRELRMIKDASEICKMKKSAHFAYNAYLFIRKKLRMGVTELELARRLELYCLEKGAEKMSFEPIIAFGKNSALPHHHPGKTKLKENDIALFDLGVVLDGYCSDMTRVDFVGKENRTLRHLFDINRAAQRMALANCKPGVKLKELDSAARKVMKSADLEHLYVHSLGHGVGLEIHESPSVNFDGSDRNMTLKEGMFITIEPGLYLPGKGGVRYEDTIMITKKGYKNLYPQP